MSYTLSAVKRYQKMIKAAQLALAAPVDFAWQGASALSNRSVAQVDKKRTLYRKQRRHKNQIARASRKANR